MSYPRFYDQLPSRRFATSYGGRVAAANYHGTRIARLLAAKMGVQPANVLPLMSPPLAREAARGLGMPAGVSLGDIVDGNRNGGRRGR